MSITNVTPPRATPLNPRSRNLLLWVVAVLAVAFVLRACAAHENSYEKIARDVTVSLQKNDLAGVQKLQNAETATHIDRGIVGRAADTLAPLGALKKVQEVTPKDAAPRVHEFDVTFDKGKIHELMKLDPENKIVTFHYDPVAS